MANLKFGSPTPEETADSAPAADGGAYPGGNWNPANWEWKSPPGGTILPPQQGPNLSFSNTAGQNAAIMAQGAGQVGHGLGNWYRSFGNYVLPDVPDRVLSLLGQNLPASPITPDPSFANQQAKTQQARTEMGPVLDDASMLAGMRTWMRGTPSVELPGPGALRGGASPLPYPRGPTIPAIPGAGPLAEKAVGQTFLNPALQAATYGGTKAAVDDPTNPWDIPVEAGKWGIPAAVGGLAVNRIASPFIRQWYTNRYGGSTPESIAENLNQTATGAEQQATSQATTAQQTLDQQLANIRIPSKSLGFKVEGQTDPSVVTTQGYRDWLQSQGVNAPVTAPVDAAKLNAQYTGPSHFYDEGNPGYRQWLKNQAIRSEGSYVPPHNLPTATERMMDSINQQLNDPSVAGPTAVAQGEAAATTQAAQDAAAAARTKANLATDLASGNRRAGLPGQNVPAEFAARLNQPNLTPDQIQAFTNVAQSGLPGKGPELWQAVGRLLGGTAAGTGIHAIGGSPTEAAIAGMFGQQAGAEMFGKVGGPVGAAAIQRAIAQSYPALDLPMPAASRGMLSASDAVRKLYGLQ